MAIARVTAGATKSASATTSATQAFDATGADFLVLALYNQDSSVNSPTYNSVAFTKVVSHNDAANTSVTMEIWVLAGPASGSHNIQVDSIDSIAKIWTCTSFSGVKQTNTANVTNFAQQSGTGNQVVSLTTTVDGCWTLATNNCQGANPDGFVNCSYPNGEPSTANPARLADSGASVGVAGSYTIGWHTAGTGAGIMIAIAIEPPPAGPANIKTVDGLAIASVKTMKGLATGSVKSWNGVT